MQVCQSSAMEATPSLLKLGQGAVFWVHVSPDFQTPGLLKYWKVTLEHEDKLWKGEISSLNPAKILKTPLLSGIFNVTVEVMGQDGKLRVIKPFLNSQADIGCNLHCASMIGLEADENQEIRYWTVWNSFCHYDDQAFMNFN